MSANYTLILASKNYSSWSLRPWLAMKMADIPFTEEIIPLYTPQTKERIAPLSPSGKLPVLKIEEKGKTHSVWDSLAICETLAERHPEKAFWPRHSAQRAEARSICAEMHSGFPDVRKTLPMDLATAQATPELDENVQVQIARIAAMWTSLLERFGDGGGFLFGGFSIADCFYAPVVTRFDTYAIELPPLARAYAQRIRALPPMQEWTEAARKEPKRQD
ncbi:MAG: hypothetical protein RJB62_334 [Pseudomonadota bacterium]|jgi:glutathione S-transferase